jgi:protein SCO1/2
VKLTLALFAAVLMAGCSSRGSLPSYGVVPDFTLTDASGQVFDSRTQLDGKVWLASFIFTTCNGPCPRMSTEFRKIRQASSDLDDFRLVSFTIDPARDTPEVLAKYAKAFGADPARWTFLTGDVSQLNKLSWDTFHLGKVDASLEHSTRFVLIDRKSRIRGYYDSRDTEGMPGLLSDVKQLLKETL